VVAKTFMVRPIRCARPSSCGAKSPLSVAYGGEVDGAVVRSAYTPHAEDDDFTQPSLYDDVLCLVHFWSASLVAGKGLGMRGRFDRGGFCRGCMEMTRSFEFLSRAR
jgi:hypothetical protein